MPAIGRVVASGAIVALALAGCADPEVSQRQPVSSVDGIQATGQFDGHRIAVSDGEPEVALGDCDLPDGVDEDLCIVAFTIDGSTLALVVENPGVLEVGDGVPITNCAGHCDDAEGVVVEVRLDGVARRASSGSADIAEAGPRWRLAFTLRFGGADRLTGEFDVRPPNQ
ncbi:MAG: hypothetical protein R3249_10040 [Nitriliruptorales bacterium]|nr:hypothetical protein [Nitriliruptorales bacterium]